MSLTVKHPFTSAIADDPTAAAAGQVLPSHWNTSHTVTGSVDATQMPALTGDVTTVAGAVATTLATVNANTGTFGDSTHVAQVTLNGKGLVTAASSVAITASVAAPLTLASGSLSSSSPFLTGTQTWNNGSAYFTAYLVNITNTASGSPASGTHNAFVDFQVGGTSSLALLQDVPNGAGGHSPALAFTGSGLGGIYIGADSDGQFIVGYGLSFSAGTYVGRFGVNGYSTPTSYGYYWGNGPQNFAQDTGFERSAAGVVKVVVGVGGGLGDITARTYLNNGTTVASLPASPVAGMQAYVTDGTGALAWGATVTGGGSTKYLVWYNGANWTVMGK